MRNRWLWLWIPLSFAPAWVFGLYHLHLANLLAIGFILIASLNLLFGVAGQISVGHIAFYGIGAYVAAILMLGGLSFWLAVPAAMLAAGLAGFVLGLPCLRLRNYHLAMATLGFGIVFFVVSQNWTAVTGGANGLGDIPRPTLAGFELTGEGQFFLLSCTIAWLVLALLRNLQVLGPGLRLRAVRESESAAASLGVDLTGVKLLAFTLSTALAGLSGALFASFSRYIAPSNFTIEASVVALCAVVVGGLGTNRGTFLGAAFMVWLPELFDEWGQSLLIYSIALLIVMLWFPRGMAGMVETAWDALRRTRAAAGPGWGGAR